MMMTREIPATACIMSVGEFAMGDNGENAKSAPIKMVARSGDPIEHWYWGRIVHDLEGMTLHKPRIPVDYRHDEPIGYLNKFDTSSGDLEVSGALVPYGDRDKATEVIYKAKNGVPYEASIDFSGPMSIEEIGEGITVEVNGRQFVGPGVVVRKWYLRGVAVTPYGADMYTESQFEKGKKVIATVMNKVTDQGDRTMSNETVEVEAVEPETVEAESELAVEIEAEASAEVVETETSEPVEVEAQAETVDAEDEQVEPEAKAEAQAVPGEQFMAAFGEVDGAIYFAKGMKFEDAKSAHIEKLAKRIEELETRLAERAERGYPMPVEFTDVDREQERKLSLADIISGKSKMK